MLICETEPSEVYLQNGSAHEVGASYSVLYKEGKVEHINIPSVNDYESLP